MAKAKPSGKLSDRSRKGRTQERVPLALEIAPGQVWARRGSATLLGPSYVIIREVTVAESDDASGPRVRVCAAARHLGSEGGETWRMRVFLRNYDLDFDPRGVWSSRRDPGVVIRVDGAEPGRGEAHVHALSSRRSGLSAGMPVSELRRDWERATAVPRATESVKLDAPPASDFGWALTQLRAGKRVARAGWNGKGMWLVLVEGKQWHASVRTKDELGRARFTTLPWIGMKTADYGFVPWLASQTDMLATDWVLAP